MPRTKDKLTDYLALDQLAKLNHIRQHTKHLWAHGTFLHPFFTLHGEQHSQQVEMIIEHILAPGHRDHHRLEDMLGPDQLFCLLASAWLHDTGMIWPPTEQEKHAASQEGMSISDWIRKEHHERSHKYIVDHARELLLGPIEANIIASICRAHRGKNLTSNHNLESGYGNTRYLAALLRVADELDVSTARTPPQLLELRWNEMDRTSRWHWLKHWCILRADPYYEELKHEKPPILQLTYQFFIRLPSHQYLIPFWDRLMRPIRDVIEEQGVDAILRQKHLAIGCGSFKSTVLLCNDLLPDGTRLEECLDNSLMPGASLLSDVVAAYLDKLRSRNSAAATMLQRQCRWLANAASLSPDISNKVGSALEQYLSALTASDSLSAIEDLHERFKDIGREILKESEDRGDILADVEKEWLKLSDLGRRLMILVIGDESDRRAQLWHIFSGFESESNDLLAQVATKDPSASVRGLALALLAKKGTPEFCKVVLDATEDKVAEVRVEAVKALRHFPGPRIYERLGQILGADVDGEVRRAAETVRQEFMVPPDTMYQKYPGRKVLLIDDERYVVPPLVDALERRDIEVRVVIRASELLQVLESWKPDVVVCELVDVDPGTMLWRSKADDLPGLYLARLVREKLGSNVHIITTSTINPEDIGSQLASVRSVYVRKPTTVETFVNTILSLFPPQQ